MATDTRTYIRLHDGMPENPKVDALSDKGFRSLIDLWCWCSRNLSDGFVAEATWKRRATTKVRRELLDAGLVEVVDGGVMMHDYLEHQRSREEVRGLRDVRRSAAEMGNHNRWHVARSIVDPTCEICAPGGEPDDSNFPPEVIASPVANGSQVRSQTDRKTSPESDREGVRSAGADHTPAAPSAGRARSATKLTDEEEASFAAFYAAYPRREAPLDAKRAYAKALKVGSAEDVMAGLKRWLPLARETERRYIPQPAAWLNKGRWLDEAAPSVTPRTPSRDQWMTR